MKKVCHISTVHSRYDVRIFHKECKSLKPFYDVSLVIADGLGDEIAGGIKIFDIGLRQTSRLKRARIDSKKALQKALELDCDLYHFHDPELIFTGLKLKKAGKKVIYDVHEDLPRQIAGKPYLKDFVKPPLSRLVEWQENKAARKFDFICCATPYITERFRKINPNSIDINNFPILGELHKAHTNKENTVCYLGGITEERGIINIVKSLKDINTRLVLAGPVDNNNYLEEMKSLPEWNKVDFLGLVDRSELADIMAKSIAGLVTFLPLPNHINAQPNKMFEYMSARLPVIASDFKLWKEIIDSNNCGLTVNPLNTKEISDAIKQLTENPDKAKQMGENGQKAVMEKYNWDNEEKKLLDVYSKLLP